jgi:osmotically-inducible protein OsmY
MTPTIEKKDTELKMNVLAQLEFEPSVKIADIGVLVKEGVVTLNGHADNHGEKLNAVRAARRVAGVLAIADEIEVNLPEFGLHTDSDLAASAVNRLGWSTEVPAGAVAVTVREGWVTLEGAVEWGYQKHAAESAVEDLAGVKGVSNLIHITSTLTTEGIQKNIAAAIRRNALLENVDIRVETTGSTVVLRGKVRNHAELEEAVRLAWAPLGVHTVDNRIKVEWFWGVVD